MAFRNINPKNGKLIKTFDHITNHEMLDHLEKANRAFKYMRTQGSDGFKERFEKFNNLKALMADRKQRLAEAITNDNGKPIRETIAEVEKSMTMIDYYVQNTEAFAASEKYPHAKYSDVRVVN